MNRIIKLTESDIQRITEKVLRERGFNIKEDFASDMKKNMQAGAKQSNINATKCPLNYKPVSAQEIAKYKNSTSPPPWRDTRSGDHGYMTLKNGIICRSDRRENLEAKPTITLDQVVESARAGMGSLVGIGVQVLLEFLEPVGPALNTCAWGLLSIYDINKAIQTKKPNWVNIIVDLIGVATTGLGAPGVKAGLSKLSRFASQEIEYFLMAVEHYAPNIFKYIKPILSKLSGVFSKILTQVTKFLELISTKMKGTSLYNSISKLLKSAQAAKVFITEIEVAIGEVAYKIGERGYEFGVDLTKDYAKEKTVHNLAHQAVGGHHPTKHGVKPKPNVAKYPVKPKPSVKPTGYITTNKIKPTVRPIA